MGISRRNRPPNQADKENAAKFNRESRPWDNQASHGKLPKLSAPIPIRPPPPRSPAAERFVPLLRSPNPKVHSPTSPHRPTAKASPAPMSVSPRRKADHLSSSPPFTPVAAAAFQAPSSDVSMRIAGKRDLFEGNANRSTHMMSVSDRMRLFERVDESARERPSTQLLRNSPFKGALDAFVVGAPDEMDFSDSSKSSSSSDRNEIVNPQPVLQLKTKIGNREVTPLLSRPKPPPLVGLPIPRVDNKIDVKIEEPQVKSDQGQTAHNKRLSRLSVRHSKISGLDAFDGDGGESLSQDTPVSEDDDENTQDTESSRDLFDDLELDNHEGSGILARGGVELPAIPDVDPISDPGASRMSLEDPDLMPRFSYRHSVRVPRDAGRISNDNGGNARKSSFENSKRAGDGQPSDLNFLPKSSSFLDFDDDSRLVPFKNPKLAREETDASQKASSTWTNMSFDDPDSFDTFATLPKGLKPAKDLKASIPVHMKGASQRPGTDESEKPVFPVMSFSKKTKVPHRQEEEDNDDGTLDVPNRFTHKPGAEKALRDLQRASVTVGNEISASLRMMNIGQSSVQRAVTKQDKVSRVQGDILLRSRIFRKFNLRYASIVQQGYFGAVLLLFKTDSKGSLSPAGTFTLKSSKMIALAESSVRKVDSVRKSGGHFLFELKTSQRTYTFACNDERTRDFWVKNLSGS